MPVAVAGPARTRSVSDRLPTILRIGKGCFAPPLARLESGHPARAEDFFLLDQRSRFGNEQFRRRSATVTFPALVGHILCVRRFSISCNEQLLNGFSNATGSLRDSCLPFHGKVVARVHRIRLTWAPPFSAPPRTVRTNGARKQSFITLTSSHARIYDIFIRFAALLILPVSAISASKSALPGPSAIAFPRKIRIRGVIFEAVTD